LLLLGADLEDLPVEDAFASAHGLALHRILPSPIPSRTRVTFTVFTTDPLQNQGHLLG
jgi:hypothetical protein